MRIRIERLRVWLLASAALLVVVLGGFIGTARYLRRHWLARMPQKLGLNVKVDTSGITLSHTNRGQTDYVVHAGREVEHADGKVALHDVWMKLCGRQQKRADIVRGDDWEWDKKTGVIHALGVVHIELRDADGSKHSCTATNDYAAGAGGIKTTRVTTSNLIYMQDLGVAATSAPIEFASGTMEGHAVGADYASDSGTLMLHSAVSMRGMSAGQPVEIEAASAELDGQQRVARLTGAKYTTGGGTTARTVQADHAVLHLRADQTLERIEAQGNVTMQADGGMVSAAKMDVTMNAAGHPVSALMTGDVRYALQEPLAERRGNAEQAVITLDGKPNPQAQHAVFTGAVHLMERTRASTANSTWSTRELTAARLEIALAPGADGKNQVRDAEATGGARFAQVNSAGNADKTSGATGAGTTEIAADDLKAHFAGRSGVNASSPAQIETMAGRGHTLVRKVNAASDEQTSAGDVLDARFRPAGTPGKKSSKGGESGLADADSLIGAAQTGHVEVTRKDAANSPNAPRNEMRITAQQAIYDGDSGRMTLSGGVQVMQTGSRLWANQLIVERATGNAQGTGDVKAEYAVADENRRQSPQSGTEPVHVSAERADLDHAADTVTFHGTPTRMWQSGSQVQAPVIEIQKTARRLLAHGETANGDRPAQVHTVLTGAGGGDASVGQPATGERPCAVNASGSKPGAGAQDVKQPQVVRIDSGGLVYSDGPGEADFTGGFRAEMADATVRAETGIAYLVKDHARATSATKDVPSLSGRIDRVMAKGQVTIARSDMQASGGQLTYATVDRSFLLTGDAKSQPKAVDERGNVTMGPALKFHRACDSMGGDTVVEVLNRVPGKPEGLSGSVHTEVQADAKKEQPKR